MATAAFCTNVWYLPETKTTTAVLVDGKPATMAQIAILCKEYMADGLGFSPNYWFSALASSGKYGRGADWKGPAAIVHGQGNMSEKDCEWKTADLIMDATLGAKFKAEVLPQATLIAAAGQRHMLGDAGWEESAFAPMVAEIKKW